jgi:Cys-tRNA(Pro) deacylase
MTHLDSAKIPYKLIQINEHVVTAIETAQALHCEVAAILKSLVVYDVNNPAAVCIVVLPGDQRLNLEIIGKILGYAKSKLLPMDKVLETVGYSVGTLPPWGYKPGINVYYEKCIFDKTSVYAGSGDATFLINFNPKDLITNATFKNV